MASIQSIQAPFVWQTGQVFDLMLSFEEFDDLMACVQKSGQIWECFLRTKDPSSGGYVYKMKEKEGYKIGPVLFAMQRAKSQLEMATEELLCITSEVIQGSISLEDAAIRTSLALQRQQLSGQQASAAKNRLETECKQANAILKQQFPALEALPQPLSAAVHENGGVFSVEKVSPSSWESFLYQLGFHWERDVRGDLLMQVPDVQVLRNRWHQMREKNPSLPLLSLTTSKGIATDEEFIEALIKHDLLVSEGAEFGHDLFVHASALFNIIWSLYVDPNRKNVPSYQAIRDPFKETLKREYQQVQAAKQGMEERKEGEETSLTPKEIALVTKILSAYADDWSAQQDWKTVQNQGVRDVLNKRPWVEAINRQLNRHDTAEGLRQSYETARQKIERLAKALF